MVVLLQPENWPPTACSFSRKSASGLCSFSWLLIICMQITFFIVMWRSVAVLNSHYVMIPFFNDFLRWASNTNSNFSIFFSAPIYLLPEIKAYALVSDLISWKVQYFMCEFSNVGNDSLLNLYKRRRLRACKNIDFWWPCLFCKFTWNFFSVLPCIWWCCLLLCCSYKGGRNTKLYVPRTSCWYTIWYQIRYMVPRCVSLQCHKSCFYI